MDKESLASKIGNSLLREAFLKVNREDYLPDHLKGYAYSEKYVGQPLVIFPGVTTTALELGLYMLDKLELAKGQRVLEIGTGIGYYTALMAEVVEKVVSVEIHDDMYEYAKKRLNYPNVKLVKGDGTLGYEEEAPYDRVIAWASAPTLLCKPFEQLREGGIMVLPMGWRTQWLYKVKKVNNRPVVEKLSEVIFMKMRGVYGFYEEEEDDVERRVSRLEAQLKGLLSRLGFNPQR